MFSRAQFCIALGRNNGLLLPARMCTAAHTLDVKKKIGEKKEAAKVGGGVKRIETQHKRVRTLALLLSSRNMTTVIKNSPRPPVPFS